MEIEEFMLNITNKEIIQICHLAKRHINIFIVFILNICVNLYRCYKLVSHKD